MTLRLLPEARTEFDQATDWYESHRAGMGAGFVMQIERVFDRIVDDPERHATIYLDIRKASVPKFPYIVLYRVDDIEIVVISVFHTSRNPSIWKSRA